MTQFNTEWTFHKMPATSPISELSTNMLQYFNSSSYCLFCWYVLYPSVPLIYHIDERSVSAFNLLVWYEHEWKLNVPSPYFVLSQHAITNRFSISGHCQPRGQSVTCLKVKQQVLIKRTNWSQIILLFVKEKTWC